MILFSRGSANKFEDFIHYRMKLPENLFHSMLIFLASPVFYKNICKVEDKEENSIYCKVKKFKWVCLLLN